MERWEKVAIGSVAAVLDGPHATPKTIDTGPIFLGIGALQNGRINLGDTRHVSPDDFTKWTRRVKPRSGDVVFSYETRLGEAAIIPEGLECCLGRRMGLVRPLDGRLDARFFLYYYLSPQFQELLRSRTITGATVDRIALKDFPSFGIPLPDVKEQRDISTLLGALDDKIELNRRMNGTLEASARALFRDWFVDFGPTRARAESRPGWLAPELWSLFPDRLGDDGLPLGWEWESLLDQAHWVNGAAYKNMHFVDRNEGLPVVKIAELKAGVSGQTKFTNTDLGARYRIDDGELLFSWSGNPDTSIDAFVWTDGAAWLNQHIFAVRENGKRTKAELFVLLKWLMPQFAEIARNKQTTGLGHVTKDDMKRLQVVVASQPVRKAFSQRVAPVFDQILSNITESRTLAATRDALLPKLMSGELRVRDAEALAA